MQGLTNIRHTLSEFNPETAQDFNKFTDRVPIPKTVLESFTKSNVTWNHPQGWNISNLTLRKDQGQMFIVETSTLQKRFDGRKNINFQEVRNARTLRRVKSFYLQVTKIRENMFRVTGGSKPHIVAFKTNRYVCDCGDFQYRKNRNCKHIQAVQRPQITVDRITENLWLVTVASAEFTVSFENNNYSCPCKEFQSYNICPHVAALMKDVNDYQYSDTEFDLGKSRGRKST